MPLSPETIAKHELVGLQVRVVESTDPSRVGLAGRVVRETMRTLVVATASGERQVPKAGSTFEFAIDEAAEAREPSGTASKPTECGGTASAVSSAGQGVAYVTVEGDVLLARPALRTENGVDPKWR